MTADRTKHIAEFLAAHNWAKADRRPLAGDASTRRYIRLMQPSGDTAMLMDADPAVATPTRPFVTIARHLLGLGLAAPEILAWDEEAGLLLIEDLGDDLVARVVTQDPTQELNLYEIAVDALIALHRHPIPTGIAPYDHAMMADRASLAVSWYVPGAAGRTDEPGVQRLYAEVKALLDQHCGGIQALALRDYHAENLIWLPGRAGPARMGLLDFQDAGGCHPAYDLVSLVEDARRDVSPDVANAMIDRYIAHTGVDAKPFRLACAVCAAQRNLRILGVFARLSMHFAKPHYIDLIPRVWAHLARDLSHPELAGLHLLVTSLLPEPTPARLDLLRQEAGKWPTL